jgi:hypothetical protein
MYNEYPEMSDALLDAQDAMSRQTTIEGDDSGRRSRPSSANSVGQVRNLSQQEIVKRNKDAVDWFRASRAINRNIRSIEDTEELLTNARERRKSGTDFTSRRKSKEIPLGLPKPDAKATTEAPKQEEEEEAQSKQPARIERKRSVVDPAALWAAKPVAPKPKEEPKIERPKVPACMRGQVQVGETGENGLLARLRRRKTVH